MSDLNIYVKRAEINHADDKLSSYVLLKLGNYVRKSKSVHGLVPEWNENFLIKNVFISSNANITIELWSDGFFFDKKLGVLLIPISSVKQSDQQIQGETLSPAPTAEDDPRKVRTKHKVWLEAKFVPSLDERPSRSEDISSKNSKSGFSHCLRRWIERIFSGNSRNARDQLISRSGWIEGVSNNSKDQPENSLLNRSIQEEINQLYADIEKTPRFDAKRRNSIFIIERPVTSQKVSAFKNFSLQDEKLKAYVYKKSLQAIISPPSASVPHAMEAWQGRHVANCFECQGFMWGTGGHGIVRCRKCGLLVHENCRDLLINDCKQTLLNDGSGDGSSKEASDRRERQMNKGELLRKVFKVDSNCHDVHVEEARKESIDGSPLERISITVVCAKGLVVKDNSGTSDPYVTLQIGKIKKRSKTIQETVNPVWNETFNFVCTNASDRIKIRVWDQDRNFQSAMKTFLTRTCADEFLGQKIIDLKSIVGETDDLWYTLEKRGKKSTVSGSIRLNISRELKGEELLTFPSHKQYFCLHQNIFQYLIGDGTEVQRFPISEAGGLNVYFDDLPQEVVEEFAERCGVEVISRAFMHFSCLCEVLGHREVPLILNHLLENIKTFYQQTIPSDILMREHLSSSNVGNWDFMKILDLLFNCLKLNLSSYRTIFPSNVSKSSWHLESTLKLFVNVGRFKGKFQKGDDVVQEAVLGECMKACLETTYERLFNNCNDIYDAIFVRRQQQHVGGEGPGCKRNLEFWYKLVALVTSAIEEDETFYSNIFNKFQKSKKLEELSSSILWESLTCDLRCVLEEHRLESHCENKYYVNLHNCINDLYDKFIVKNKPITGPPEYPLLFEPFINRWLKENNSTSIAFATSAYKKDKIGQYQKASELSFFSCSVTDVFSLLNQCYGVISIFVRPHPLVGMRYKQSFAMTVEMVLMTYSALLMEDFPSLLSESEITCRLMNNIHQLRVELEKLVICMGGAEPRSAQIFKSLQRRFGMYLRELVSLFCSRLRDSVDEKIFEMRRMLAKQNITSSLFTVSKEQFDSLNAEASKILNPLVTYLDSTLSQLARLCERRVLRRILKELWKLTLKDMECLVIAPPLIRNGKVIIGEKLNPKLLRHLKAPIRLTPGQCLLFDVVVDHLKTFFWANNNGLRLKYLEGSGNYSSLKDVLCLSSQTTEVLVKVFIDSQSDQIPEKLAGNRFNESLGQLSFNVEVDELADNYRVTVRVLAVEGIKWPIPKSIFQPFVEISVLGPHVLKRKRPYATKYVRNSWSPEYNETFIFSLGKASALEFYELHFCLMDYRFIWKDNLLGISVFQLKTLSSQRTKSMQCRIPFKSCVHVDHTGDTVVRILATRTNDQAARHFVNLKTNSRKKSE